MQCVRLFQLRESRQKDHCTQHDAKILSYLLHKELLKLNNLNIQTSDAQTSKTLEHVTLSLKPLPQFENTYPAFNSLVTQIGHIIGTHGHMGKISSQAA